MDFSPFLRKHCAPLFDTACHTAWDRPVDREWQVAQERVLLYLRTLEIGAPEALELALEALRRAAKRHCQTAGDHPAASAMLALSEILRERSRGLAVNPTGQPAGDALEVVEAIPPLNRGSMVVEEIGQRSRIAFLPRRVQQQFARIRRLITAGFFYCIVALFFLMIALLADAWRGGISP